ncbi:chromate efflux transporter [Xanthobacter versatilis]|uniref:chromate efflux transporter n=1 Tax=Xanthobacter autotrophicus (strain ATCC BAA-1158 / Py2) TaxID=78245 RepID=UPI00372D855C
MGPHVMTEQGAPRAQETGAQETGEHRTGAPPGSPGEVFGAFLKLGLTSFGGPVAHLGYFRDELVLRRRWMDDAAYGDLVALCQFLPGPASSQLGFTLGLLRGGGLLGGLAAWAGFTLPSAIALTGCALGAASLAGTDGVLHGLKLVAVAVVAQAVWGMTRTLTPDRDRAGIALAALALVVFAGSALGQVVAIALGALAGLVLCAEAPPVRGSVSGPEPALTVPLTRRTGALLLALFAVLLVVPPVIAAASHVQALALFDAFYRSGALVFGGGHVVLPLLQAEVVAPGWVSASTFLAGYGLAQAVPGPLFTFAAYLGAAMGPEPNGIAGAAIALVAIFLPGLLLVTGMLPFWDQLRRRTGAQAAMRGANAAVVGLIGAALYSPVFTGAVFDAPDFVAAVAGFLLLTVWRVPPLAVVVLLAGAGVLLA